MIDLEKNGFISTPITQLFDAKGKSVDDTPSTGVWLTVSNGVYYIDIEYNAGHILIPLTALSPLKTKLNKLLVDAEHEINSELDGAADSEDEGEIRS